MSCNCSCSYNNLPCCCPTGEEQVCPTTICPDAQSCDKKIESKCIIYNGSDYECAGIETGMTVAEVVNIIINSLNLKCTTTTTTSTTTTTTTSTTSTTTSSTTTTSTTTTTTIKPGTDECHPIELQVSCNCTYQTFSTASYSAAVFPPVPGCTPNGYLGNNIWFTFTVPASGEVIISTSALQITDGVFSVYNGGCLNLNEIVCVDDSQGGITMPEVHLTGLTPGDILLIRFWGYGGAAYGQVGTFEICVNDPSCCSLVPIIGTVNACATTTTTTTIDCTVSGGTASPLEEFIMEATTITSLRFRNGLFASIPFYVDWGDGTIDYFPTGSPNLNTHTYSTPYTGLVKIISSDLSSIVDFWDPTPTYLNNNSKITVTTSELGKLDNLFQTDFVETIVIGDVKFLPASLTRFVCWGRNQSSPITGDVKDLPRDLVFTNILGQNTLFGKVIDFPRTGTTSTTYAFNVLGNNTIDGDIADLPTTGYTICNVLIQGNNTISGDIANIPTNYRNVRVDGNNTINGDIANLPATGVLQVLFITGFNTITGDLSVIPALGLEVLLVRGNNIITGLIEDLNSLSNLISVNIEGNNIISGDISLLTLSNITFLLIHGNNTIGGNFVLTGVPALITIEIRGNNVITGPLLGIASHLAIVNVFILGNNSISGDAADMPPTVAHINIQGFNTINTYTAPHAWFSPMKSVSFNSTNVMSTTVIDNLLIDLNSATMQSGSQINLKGVRSSLSDAAVLSLIGQGVTINIIP